jgi:hypothetical protein
LLDGTYRFCKSGKFLRFDFVEAQAKAACNAKMHGNVELDAGALGPIATVFDVMGESFSDESRDRWSRRAVPA